METIMDKITYNNKIVELNENHNNTAISVSLLPEEEMRKIGFTDFAKDKWYYCHSVFKKGDITFNLSIPKEHPEQWRIDILDEAFCQPYDYQYMLDKGGTLPPAALEVNKNVEKQMEYLKNCGIISGHEYGDYI